MANPAATVEQSITMVTSKKVPRAGKRSLPKERLPTEKTFEEPDNSVFASPGVVFSGAAPVVSLPAQLKKATAAVHLHPISGSYSHFSRRVFNGLLALACRAWNVIPPEGQGEVFDKRITPRFKADISDLRTMLNISKNDHGYERFYEAVDNLYRMEFRFDVMEDLGKEFQVASRLISQWKRDKLGSGSLEWEYPPDVFQMLMRPMPFAMIDMHLANSLNSGYALALYENTCRYVNNPSKLTRRLPVEVWMDLVAGSRERYNGEYRYFKRYCLKPSLTELEASDACPLQLTLLETKGLKNKVTHLQFQVELKKQLQLPTKMGRGPDPRLTQKLRELGVTERTLNKLVIALEEDDLQRHYDSTLLKMKRGTVGNPAGYFVEICNSELEKMQRLQPGLSAAEILPPPLITGVPLPSPQELFQKLRGDRLREYYAVLTEVQKSELLEKFFEHKSAGKTVRDELERAGLKSKIAAGTFFWWLSQDDCGQALLSLPEEIDIKAFIQWNQAAIVNP